VKKVELRWRDDGIMNECMVQRRMYRIMIVFLRAR
jgi:hypothetical protein